MKYSDYPALYQAADAASLRNQILYNRLLRGELVLIVTTATLGAFSFLMPPSYGSWFAIVAAGLLAGAILTKGITQWRDLSGTWFDGRAVAETLKSSTWRYMLRVDPFDDDAKCDDEFTQEIRAILKARQGLADQLNVGPKGSRQITEEMRCVRKLPVQARRDYYITYRLDNQTDWYGNRATLNRKASNFWFWSSLFAQVLALICAIVRIAWPLIPLSTLGLFTTAAAAMGAWTQARRNDELAKAYSLAYQELLTIRSFAESTTTEDALVGMVRDCEGAISREHTMWMAKRAEPLPSQVSRAS